MNRSFSRIAAAMLALAALAGCDSILGSGDDAYTLRSVNGAALPVSYNPGDPSSAVDIVSGKITLGDGGAVTEEWKLACKNPLPSGVTACTLSAGGRTLQRGTYSPDTRTIQFETQSSLGGTPAEVSSSAVVVHYGQYAFEYRR
jgi:hypothetical protein